ncbi:MAG TPA: electron transfer flavoprotein subunit beta/FixA family protein [Bacteroidota bacterium]|nr:electron transfer flavoprotein subunit beta/FixA family protein [Bacteroidota bacterium]
MKEDGTVNRSKLSAIFNFEDKVALEFALQVKDKCGGKVTAVTMGPPRASDILRECLYMGADEAILITDRKFAGADTLATSYVLSEAIKKIGNYSFVFAGRQAIDGDTAQVGPQTAEKLGIPQITYAEEIIDVSDECIRIRKKIDGGYEILESKLPLMITVLKDAAQPRPFSAKRVMAYKGAKSLLEIEKMAEGNSLLYVDKLVFEYKERSLFIPTLTAEDLQMDFSRCGVKGSPTKVYNIESVVLSGNDPERVENSKAGMNSLIDKLLEDRILG